ncbi:MAG: HAMP domain-containing sensor histidine kinase [Gemmatimonadota bacterium]|jgi:signal transduction histidine kinase
MMEVVFFVFGLMVGGILAWVFGRRRGLDQGARQAREELAAFAEGLRAGNIPDPGRTDQSGVPEVREMREILARHWIRRPVDGEDETVRALGRIAAYLRHRVESPLLEGLEEGGGALRDRADDALVAIEDLEFFLEDPPAGQEPETTNLTEVIQDVTREFAGHSELMVKVQSPQGPVKVRIEPEPLKDAVFLILHNASEFAGGRPVQIALAVEGGRASVRIRDSGPGFSAEALLTAMDPFYSTSSSGLGLGLPHARRAVNSQGGELFLRNPEGGGAEVEIRLPLAE